MKQTLGGTPGPPGPTTSWVASDKNPFIGKIQKINVVHYPAFVPSIRSLTATNGLSIVHDPP